MGITSDNKLYGIASDGILYKISITDGSETSIGSTGLILTMKMVVLINKLERLIPKIILSIGMHKIKIIILRSTL